MVRTLLTVLGLTVSFAVSADDVTAGSLEIGQPWALPPPPGAPSVAGYLSVTNQGEADERLIGATAAFADRVEIHETRIDGDVARMRKLTDGIIVPAGHTVMLAPNGAHLMLIDPEPLSKGDRRTVTLEFERQGPVEVDILIERPDDMHDVPSMDHEVMGDDAVEHMDEPSH